MLVFVAALAGCRAPMSERPPNSPDGSFYYPSIIEQYERRGYRYHPPVIASPARLEYIGTNKPPAK